MELKKNKYNIFLIIVWFIIVFIVMINHEIWRDESQVWCLVRDLNIFEVFNKARLEGHPILWYLLVFPFAKTGLPLVSMQIISFLCVFLSVLYVCFKSDFNNYIKTVFVFSSGMLYYMPVVARNYALIPLFLFPLADFYLKRKSHPYLFSLFLILLSQTHVLMLGLCFIVFFIYTFEIIFEFLKTKDIKLFTPVIIQALNFLLLFLTFYNMQNMNHAVVFYSDNTRPIIEAITIFAQMFFLYPFSYFVNFNAVIFYVLSAVLGYLFYKNDKKIFLIFLVSFSYIFFIYYKIWFNGIVNQKAFTLILCIIFCYWISRNKTKGLNIAIGILLTICAIPSIFLANLEITHQFTGAKQIADYIKENLNDEEYFYAVGYPFTFTSISAYLPNKKFFSYLNNYFITYYDFDTNTKTKKEAAPEIKYIIAQEDFPLNDNFEVIYETDNEILSYGKYNEIFKIYKKRKKL